ncbi:N-acetyltransferase [Catellatospora sp. TT07R-123]|uniref:GNAT family N-acetyltransferase n=1 Tax=Catellatospora sp. TT07R-123 TaxID=2733863 RepID=UPI001B18D75E|nr:GNAT family N-acetyltransferase [Catellatospora sp. TT07R-123]GHJ43604.1 N-acetyltransferase [Catellatospora sp. TT07R-123]
MSAIRQAGPWLEFLADPGDFLAAAGGHLAAEPVLSTVVATGAHRRLTQQAVGITPPGPDWWLVVRDGSGTVIGTGMRSATAEPYPLFLLPMPDEAAVGVARALHARGEQALAVNGALPAVRLCADELARLSGGEVLVNRRTRLHELTELVPPRPVPGTLVAAVEQDLDLVTAWFHAFVTDADEQAGRPRGAGEHELPDQGELLRRIRSGQYWFWTDESGRRVHLTGANPPSFGVARIGPVYTPPEQRGRGWASNAVAEVSRRLQAAGVRACLFTDQANPTSNRVYAALGFRPVMDTANLVIAHSQHAVA